VRGLDENGDITERQECLKKSFEKEFKYRNLKSLLAKGKEYQNNACLFSLLDLPPCVLHLEMRVGLIMITMVLG
jgi:hypothetical protein